MFHVHIFWIFIGDFTLFTSNHLPKSSLQIEDEQNLIAFQYNENIYYRVIIDIHPGNFTVDEVNKSKEVEN